MRGRFLHPCFSLPVGYTALSNHLHYVTSTTDKLVRLTYQGVRVLSKYFRIFISYFCNDRRRPFFCKRLCICEITMHAARGSCKAPVHIGGWSNEVICLIKYFNIVQHQSTVMKIIGRIGNSLVVLQLLRYRHIVGYGVL